MQSQGKGSYLLAELDQVAILGRDASCGRVEWADAMQLQARAATGNANELDLGAATVRASQCNAI